MIATTIPPRTCISPSAAGLVRMKQGRGEPLFLADWERVLMIHFAVAADALQPVVPFKLDLWEGNAYVSLVAFTLRGMRPRRGGHLAAWLLKPIATHDFLNVRTYVQHDGDPGIHFLAEWLSNRLAVKLGPDTFSLPYRFGRITYQHDWQRQELFGRVEDAATAAVFAYQAELESGVRFATCEAGSRDEWLMERYTAFNAAGGRSRYFRVWHQPWPQCPAKLEWLETALLKTNWPWFEGAKLVGSNYSPGLRDVWLGWPRAVRTGANPLQIDRA